MGRLAMGHIASPWILNLTVHDEEKVIVFLSVRNKQEK